jgi:hypothetical protein
MSNSVEMCPSVSSKSEKIVCGANTALVFDIAVLAGENISERRMQGMMRHSRIPELTEVVNFTVLNQIFEFRLEDCSIILEKGVLV